MQPAEVRMWIYRGMEMLQQVLVPVLLLVVVMILVAENGRGWRNATG